MSTGGVFNQSSAAYGKALAGTQKAYDLYGGMGYAKPATIASGMGAYKNPYQQQVVDSAKKDIMTMAAQQQEVNAADAAKAGAFGGSRHGLVEAQTNKFAQENLAEMTSKLKMQGFDTAAGLAGQDVNNSLTTTSLNNQQQQAKIGGMLTAANQGSGLAGQGFGFGQAVTGQQTADGTTKQAINQSLLDQAQGMFGKFANQGGTLLDTLSGALTGSPLNAATKTNSTYKPGALQLFGAGTNAASGGKGGGGKGGA